MPSSGDWSLASNWNGTLLPTVTDNAYVINGGTAAITVPGAVCQNLYLGDPNSTNSGTVQMSGGNLSAQSSEYLGNIGAGTFNQSGGANNVAYYLYLGNNAGTSGSYNLSGSGLLTAASEFVGSSGTGMFVQSGGANTGASLNLGYNAGSSGSYNLSGAGLLAANNEYVGNSGAGTFIQTGGTNNLSSSSLFLGYNAGSSGSYNLSGSGVLTGYYEIVGYSASAASTFTQSAGTNNIAGGSLSLGMLLGSAGTYSLNGTGVLAATNSANEYVGNSGAGTFIQLGGANNLNANSLYVGYNAGSSGSYNLSGSGALAGGAVYVGYFGSGTFTQTGGTNNPGGGGLFLGSNAGGAGTYALGGSGVLTVAGTESVGSSGNGTFNQSAGLNLVSYLNVGNLGRYNFSGGTLQVSGGGLANQGVFNGAGRAC